LSPGRFSPGPGKDDPDDKPFRLPPALARLPEGRHRLPREFVEQNQRNRILLAALDVFGAKGFAAASVQDLIDGASTSRATFYKYFADKEEVLRAVHDEVLGWLEEEGSTAAAEASDWSAAVVAVCEGILGLFLADPRIARICGIEALLGGPEVRLRRAEALSRLEDGLRRGRVERPWGEDLPGLLEQFLVAGSLSLVTWMIGFQEEPEAEKLKRDLAEFLLGPYLGAEDARRVLRDAG
jgi:AcrR family transcriptional regulator